VREVCRAWHDLLEKLKEWIEGMHTYTKSRQKSQILITRGKDDVQK
jgi:hypothetical protein